MYHKKCIKIQCKNILFSIMYFYFINSHEYSEFFFCLFTKKKFTCSKMFNIYRNHQLLMSFQKTEKEYKKLYSHIEFWPTNTNLALFSSKILFFILINTFKDLNRPCLKKPLNLSIKSFKINKLNFDHFRFSETWFLEF